MIELQVYFESGLLSIPKGIYIGLLALSFLGMVSFVVWKGLKEGLRYSALLLLAECICLVYCVAVVFRESRAESGYSLIPFISYWDYGENSYFMERFAINMLNVILFFPIGFFMGVGFTHITWKRVLKSALFLSLSIELIQLFFRKGYCEVDDLIHNVAGCLIGYGVYKALVLVKTEMGWH